ncbi:MAG: hypothetical protein QM725_12075 [Lacibacter sp.]
MNVIVVDNLDWKTEGADLGGNPPFDIVNVSGKTFDATIEYLAGSKGFDDVVYLINVHCVFASGDTKKKYDFQQQNGIAVYRHLLKIYEDNQEKLRVAFFSPITVENLVKLKPENAVLEHLPFFNVPFNWNNCVTELQAIADWKYFNNASENLLSGWALYKKQLEEDQKKENRKKDNHYIETSKRKLVFIDDQITEWEKTYECIFEHNSTISLLLYDKYNTSVNGFNTNKIVNFNEVKTADIIISDFYLDEKHQPNIWMGKDQLEKISGFKCFENIKGNQLKKGINTGACHIIHSSSNKIPYYRILDANGIDNWLVKDLRVDSSNEEKIENYKLFKTGIEEFTSQDNFGLYESLRSLWDRLDEIEAAQKWWKNSSEYDCDEIILILKNAWFALRAFANKQGLFMKKTGAIDANFTPAAIISSLGKLNEIFKVEKLNKTSNSFQRFLPAVRNAGSHHNDLDQILLIDALIFFHCWFNALNSNSFDDAFKSTTANGNSEYMIQDSSGSQPISYKYRLFYVYMQFYNSRYSHPYQDIRTVIRKRLDTMLKITDKQKLLDEILTHQPKDKYDAILPGAKKLKDIIAASNIDSATKTNTFFISNDPSDNSRVLINYR